MALPFASVLGQLVGWNAAQRQLIPVLRSAVALEFTQRELGALVRAAGVPISNEKIGQIQRIFRSRETIANIINEISHVSGRALKQWEFNKPISLGQRYRYQWTLRIEYRDTADGSLQERFLTVGSKRNRRLDNVATAPELAHFNLSHYEFHEVTRVEIWDATFDPTV